MPALPRDPGPITCAIGSLKQMFGAFEQIFGANRQTPHVGGSDQETVTPEKD